MTSTVYLPDRQYLSVTVDFLGHLGMEVWV
jgi:hypothetical protein